MVVGNENYKLSRLSDVMKPFKASGILYHQLAMSSVKILQVNTSNIFCNDFLLLNHGCVSILGDTGFPGMKGRIGEKGDQGWLTENNLTLIKQCTCCSLYPLNNPLSLNFYFPQVIKVSQDHEEIEEQKVQLVSFTLLYMEK